MNTKRKIFNQRNRKLLVTLGIVAILGGISLAYFTGDAEPWGTIGGVFSGIGLFVIVMAGFSSRDREEMKEGT